MTEISNEKLSKYRKEISDLFEQMRKVAFKAVHPSPVIHATPGEVFRKCGKASCGCSTDDSKRHGPYKVLQIYREGKQRQVSLGKGESEAWNQAKLYQRQMANIHALRDLNIKLQELVVKIIAARTIEFRK